MFFMSNIMSRFISIEQLIQDFKTDIERLRGVRALSKQLGRDYKNVHTDAIALENVGLIQRSEEGLLVVPWDVIDAHVRLVA